VDLTLSEAVQMPLTDYFDPYESERLIYRWYEPGKDTDFYYNLQKTPSVYLFSAKNFPKPKTKDEIEGFEKDLGSLVLNVVVCKKPVKADGVQENGKQEEIEALKPEPIGVVSIRANMNTQFHHRSATLGVEFKEDAHNQGYGTEALRWALKWAFKTANFHRLQLHVFEWNERAIAVYKKVGFVEEGRLREAVWYNGKWWSEMTFAILEDEWRDKYEK
jgi:RimJ/RimL family protein N-acetyltransferase